MTVFMSTTEIDPAKTAMELSKILAKFGATQILTIYESNEIVGLSFVICRDKTHIPFKLPIRWDKVLATMKNDPQTPRRACVKEQAIRTAWRQVLRWVQAQLAMIETGAVHLEEVFLPYAEAKDGKTFYELYSAAQFKHLQLEKPKDE